MRPPSTTSAGVPAAESVEGSDSKAEESLATPTYTGTVGLSSSQGEGSGPTVLLLLCDSGLPGVGGMVLRSVSLALLEAVKLGVVLALLVRGVLARCR